MTQRQTPQGILQLVEDDLLPILECEYPGADLTGYEVYINVERPNGDTFVRQGTITFVGNPGLSQPATFEFAWQQGDLQPGDHLAEIELFDGPKASWPTSKNETWPLILLRIRREIA